MLRPINIYYTIILNKVYKKKKNGILSYYV